MSLRNLPLIETKCGLELGNGVWYIEVRRDRSMYMVDFDFWNRERKQMQQLNVVWLLLFEGGVDRKQCFFGI